MKNTFEDIGHDVACVSYVEGADANVTASLGDNRGLIAWMPEPHEVFISDSDMPLKSLLNVLEKAPLCVSTRDKKAAQRQLLAMAVIPFCLSAAKYSANNPIISGAWRNERQRTLPYFRSFDKQVYGGKRHKKF